MDEPTFNLSTTDEILILRQQQEYNQKHAGHETSHTIMAQVMFFSLFAFQYVLLYWRKKHHSSFQLASLIGLCVVPPIISFQAGFIRFLMIWGLFVIINSFIIYKATRKRMDQLTPRIVYKWFSVVHQSCVAMGSAGYCLTFISLFGVFSLFEFAILLLYYALYFGVLGRDFAAFCADRMASTVGYFKLDGIPDRHLRSDVCAICDGIIDVDESIDPLHTLECNHRFHEKCIRGWCLIGKKDICPYCKEKVDLKQFSQNAWDTQQIMHLQLLDTLRYFVVWIPIIMMVLHVAFKIFGLE